MYRMEQSVKLASAFIYPCVKPSDCIHWHFDFALCLSVEITSISSCWPNVDPFIFPSLPNTVLPKQNSLTFIIPRKDLWAVIVSFKSIQLIRGHLIPIIFAWLTFDQQNYLIHFFLVNSQAMYKFQKQKNVYSENITFFFSFPQLNLTIFFLKSSFCYGLVCH